MHLVSEKRPFWQEIVHKAFLSAINSDALVSDSIGIYLDSKAEKMMGIENWDNFKKTTISYTSQIIEGLNACAESLRLELDFYSDKDQINVYEYIKGVIAFFESRKDAQAFFPEEKVLEEYLDNYYQLLKFLFENIALLNLPIKGIGENINTVSEFLSIFSLDNNECIYSPYLAESLLKFYKSLRYANKSIVGLKKNEIHKEIIAAVYSTKVFRDFRHYVIKNHQNYLVSCENTEQMISKAYTSLSSYEMIKPLRLFGKIKRHTEDNDKKNYVIIIIGAIYIESDCFGKNDIELEKYSPEMKELCDRIASNDKTKLKHYRFDIYLNKKSFENLTKNQDEFEPKEFKEDNITINFIFSDYSEISSKNRIKSIIGEGDLILFLDCPFLYESFNIVSEDKYLKDWARLLPPKYQDNPLELSKLGSLQMIQNQLNILQLDRCEKVSHFERRLHDRKIKYISETISSFYKQDNNCRKEIFIFISSQHSINVSGYSRSFQIRMEKYNAKEICLLHFPNDVKRTNRKLLELDEEPDNNKRVFFSLWDIIVNTDPNLGEVIFNYLEEKSSENYAEFLSQIKIELSWKENIKYLKEINFFVLTLRNNKLNEFLQFYFNTIFSNKCDIEQPILMCMRNSFYNVFFSSVFNVCQALAFHHLKELLEKNSVISVTNFPPERILNDWKKPPVSTTKKAYIDVLDNLSKTYPSGTINDVLVLRMREAGLDPVDVYNNIIEACKKLNYSDTELYNNTMAARRELF